jgi:hypothetical protein
MGAGYHGTGPQVKSEDQGMCLAEKRQSDPDGTKAGGMAGGPQSSMALCGAHLLCGGYSYKLALGTRTEPLVSL